MQINKTVVSLLDTPVYSPVWSGVVKVSVRVYASIVFIHVTKNVPVLDVMKKKGTVPPEELKSVVHSLVCARSTRSSRATCYPRHSVV
jgi:hypothetical protein